MKKAEREKTKKMVPTPKLRNFFFTYIFGFMMYMHTWCSKIYFQFWFLKFLGPPTVYHRLVWAQQIHTSTIRRGQRPGGPLKSCRGWSSKDSSHSLPYHSHTINWGNENRVWPSQIYLSITTNWVCIKTRPEQR